MSSTLHNIDWQYLDNMTTTQETYTNFSHTLNNIIDHMAPERIIKIPSTRIIRDPWMTRVLIISSRTLKKLYKNKIRKDKTHHHHHKYIKYRNLYNKFKRKAKLTYYTDLLAIRRSGRR